MILSISGRGTTLDNESVVKTANYEVGVQLPTESERFLLNCSL